MKIESGINTSNYGLSVTQKDRFGSNYSKAN